MIWSKIDFEREVRRQLVELESIRKRVPENSDVHQRIDKLEASHKNVLRKLTELFCWRGASDPALSASTSRDAGKSAGKAAATRPATKSAARSSTAGETKVLQSKAVRALGRYLRTIEETAQLKKVILGGRQGLRVLFTRRHHASKLPALDAKCATCGKVLLSSILGGEEVVFIENAWHHKDCAGGDGFSKPGVLN